MSNLKKPRNKHNNILGKYPGRTLHRIGATILSVWVTSLSIKYLFPEVDNYISNQSKGINAEKVMSSIKSNATILIFILDNKLINKKTSGTIKENTNELKSLLLLSLSRKSSPILSQVPINKSIILPNNKKVKSFKNIFREGNVLLTSEILNSLLNNSNYNPYRYIIASNMMIDSLIKNTGGFKVNIQDDIELEKAFRNKKYKNDDNSIDANILIKLIIDNNEVLSKIAQEKIIQLILIELLQKSTEDYTINDIEDFLKLNSKYHLSNLSNKEIYIIIDFLSSNKNKLKINQLSF